MTLQEMLTKIPQLTTRERLMLLAALSRALNEEFAETNASPRAEGEALVDRLYGAFNPTGQALSDDDIERIRYEAIMEKHQ